jgi:hypothetical protein
MKHIVGGWPKDHDEEDVGAVGKYMKKLFRDPNYGFSQATKELVQGALKSTR